jgi:hypothetical protein
VLEMVNQQSPGQRLKENAFSKLVTSLLERELAESANPALAAKRVLKGTPLAELAEPRKRARGQRKSGEYLCICFVCVLRVCVTCSGLQRSSACCTSLHHRRCRVLVTCVCAACAHRIG